ncbi:MAG: hypothetical protein OEW45_00070 [Deltaproteobacteria bacterium]|nr:hypothetical protein [Deltaproteobacteria bacterium]
MVKGLSFRKDCSECGRTFLTPNRQARLCPRCSERVAEKIKQKQKALQQQEKKAPPSTKTSRPTPPAGLSLTDNLRAQVLKEYEVYREEKNLVRRQVHALIAKKLKIKKLLVAQALQAVGNLALPEGTEQEIIRRYQGYVMSLERPARGRRKTIAGEMGVPFRAVVLAVRKWNRQPPHLKELTREQRFFIEKNHWRNLENGKSLREGVEEIAQKIACPLLQIFRYLDFIHEGQDRLANVPDVTPDQKEAILAGYAEYLSGSAPPDLFLHTLLAEKAGVNHKQVHKVLLHYRLEKQ